MGRAVELNAGNSCPAVLTTVLESIPIAVTCATPDFLTHTPYYSVILFFRFFTLKAYAVVNIVNLTRSRITLETNLWAHLWGSFWTGLAEMRKPIPNVGGATPWGGASH